MTLREPSSETPEQIVDQQLVSRNASTDMRNRRSFFDGIWVLGGVAALCVGVLDPNVGLGQGVAERLPEVIATTPASAIVALAEAMVLVDPVGPQEPYRRFGRPDIVVLTSARPTHLSIDTMIGLLRRDTIVLAPQEVIDQLPLMISNNVVEPFSVGTTQVVAGITFTAYPASAPAPRGAEVPARNPGDIRVLMEVGGRQVFF